jgi:hypothetical protein
MVTSLLSDDEYRELQNEIVEDPERGDFVKGTAVFPHPHPGPPLEGEGDWAWLNFMANQQKGRFDRQGNGHSA